MSKTWNYIIDCRIFFVIFFKTGCHLLFLDFIKRGSGKGLNRLKGRFIF